MLLMMSENIARNMYSSRGTINYPTQLYLVGNFCKNRIIMYESMNVKIIKLIKQNFIFIFELDELSLSSVRLFFG
jgi:hypothetical protein